ncbi:MAG: aldehyde dehydrogenase family protein [Streptosporangiales bacterium]|nr:aldehyde dehydrogenase family protein [Streptosporangiales bacterium]
MSTPAASVETTGTLVAGELVVDGSSDPIEVLDPADLRRVVGRVPAMGPAELQRVFDAAERAAPSWRSAGHIARGEVLRETANRLRADAGRLTELVVREMGKTRAEAAVEVVKAADFFEYYAGLCRLPFGQLLPDARPGTLASVRHEPLGVVLLITPWNDPLLTPARKLAPALAAGNADVVKPATNTPLIVLELARILQAAGLPDGVLNTVTGRGAEIGDSLLDHPSLRAVSFTGSTPVGLHLQRQLAGRQIRMQTEMGGKNATAVLATADLDAAARAIAAGAFAQAGQRCTATARVAVRDVADGLVAGLVELAGEIRVGSGLAEGVTMGPVVSREHRDQVVEHVERAVAERAHVLTGGSAAPAGAPEYGAFVAPTVLRAEPGQRIWQDEVFGPVLAVYEVADEQEALQAVNDSSYGLSSSVFTNDLGAAERFVEGVETGQVSVNQPTTGWDVHHPFGGFRDSGSPFKEQGLDALQFYTRTKTVAQWFL